jgi:hypothetical protein
MKNRILSVHVVRREVLFGATLAAAAALPSLAGSDGFIRVDGYRSLSNSPFATSSPILNDFEVGTASEGLTIIGPAVQQNGSSVDADDASLDGTGAGGKSLALGSYAPVFAPGSATFGLSSKVLGGTVTNAGIVITGANGLEDLSGAVIPVPVKLVVALADGTTVEQTFNILSADNIATDDSFIGYSNATGIVAISVFAEIPVRVDHLQYALPSQLTPTSVRDDFNGDGKADVCWYNDGSSRVALWFMNGLTRESAANADENPTAGIEVLGSTDLNGDQRADVIWRNPSTGIVSAWLMDAGNVIEQGALAPALSSSWQFLGAGDIDGDGKGDCLFRNSNSGEVLGWIMNGLALISSATIGNASSNTFLGIGDLDGDGKDDLLWRTNANRIVGWKMNGLTVASNAEISNTTFVGTNWGVAGMPDLDGDGRADVLWRNANNGNVAAWFMNGLSRVGGGTVTTSVSNNWAIIGTSDLNADGKDDLLWRNVGSGDVYGWLMNGLAKDSSGFVRSAGSAWSPVQ